MTDDWSAYPGAMRKAGVSPEKHKSVNHSAKVYVDGDITKNGMESAFSLLKRGIVGSWHKVCKTSSSLPRRNDVPVNRRGRADLFLDTLRHMVTADPLTFERLTASD